MKEQIPAEVKNRRSEALIAEGEKAAAEFMESCRGAVRPVLFEDLLGEDDAEAEAGAENRTGLITGYTDNYIKVYARGDSDDLNSIKKVKLLERYKDGMKGEIE